MGDYLCNWVGRLILWYWRREARRSAEAMTPFPLGLRLSLAVLLLQLAALWGLIIIRPGFSAITP